ncbi:hypothetical protein SUGI_0672590 [Cryptomeria japonica]|uniref:disease resistance protein TAO1-like n=1 Tax=Cryptomeria japonica TaxID=3369 RepID=UPI002414705B|nr:disease resistance protein TAO1-like [Cryptomeria japonica]GLJ33420.1 hypothetical protein SUGI_0672590 [Cryptomeria japonica]
MASNSTTSDQHERESTSTSQGSAPSPHASVNSSSRCLFSSCFDWVFSFIPWRSVQSNSITSSSTTDLIPENRDMDAFEGITSSASISTSYRIPEREVMGASEGIVPSASASTTGPTSGSESEVMGVSTSTTGLISGGESGVVGASISATGTLPESESEIMGAFEGITPSASTSTTERIPENEDMGAFEEIAPPLSTFASTLSKKPCYDVFINHRGPDVKQTLASSIYNILDNMGVTAFLDSEELEYGDFLPTTLQAAMRSALLHVAIFSPNYAKSAWCLAELSFMLKTGAKILPIFYNVNPTDLRWVAQGKGVYVDAFLQYENKRRYSPEKLAEWKKALHDVSFYTGGIIDNNDDEARVLKNIASCVLKVKQDVPLVVAKHPVGLKETVQDFEMTMLQSAERDQGIQIVGVWGMGGSGKTTLIKEIYNKISSSMERSSFLFDVRDAAAKGMLHDKQKKLLRDLGARGVEFDNIEEGIGVLSRHLRYVRVLIVLDDVDHVEQLDALLPTKGSLGRGSLIIVITRDIDILKSWGISSVYKMKALDPKHAEQLFCWHAFLQAYPLNGFDELVQKFLIECNGLPLSLKVFGGQLYGESRKEFWELQLDKISRILPGDIIQRLKVSYDTLDSEEKGMFLDTACFFIGEESRLAIEVWGGLRWSGLRSWERLLHKCLVEIDDSNRIRMHDHLRDLGREIANQQSPYRLWFPQQIIDVQDKEEKRIGVQGIKATTTQILWTSYVEDGKPFPVMAEVTGEVDDFRCCSADGELMVNTNRGIWPLAPSFVGLKFFVIKGDYFNQVMGQVSSELLWLRWFEIGQRNLPSGLSLKKLRVLEIFEGKSGKNHLEELWGETDGEAPELRELLISECHKFRGFPKSIGGLKNLKRIVIIESFEISSLPEEFCLLHSLEYLVLFRCRRLSSLPSNFGNLRNLRHLSLCYCGKMRKLPVSLKNLRLLEYLNLAGCSQLTFTSEDLNILENMTKLEFFSLYRCKQLEELPRHITNQASLRELNLNVPSLRELPDDIGQLSRLKEMSIASVLLTSLPVSLGDLSSLANLSIQGCPKLECLPDSVGNLSLLKELEIEKSGVKFLPKSFGQLNNLQRLYISNCPIRDLDFTAGSSPFAFGNLMQIYLARTELCRISISEDCCPRLESLTVKTNPHLREIGALPGTLKSLSLEECGMLKNIPSFAQLTSLQTFELRSCYQIEKVQGLENWTKLVSLTVDTRWEVRGIESLKHMEKLWKLHLRANRGSAIERCIQTVQKWPDEIQICSWAVPDAASLVDSLLSPNFVSIDSLSNQKIQSRPKLVQRCPSTGDAIMLCFVINCVSSHMMFCESGSQLVDLSEGRWVWIGVFTRRCSSSWFATEFSIEGYGGEREEEDEVEKGLVVRGEEQRIVEAFHSLLPLLQS